jgi:hypothetical protein
MVWMLLENRVFWRLVEKVMVVDRGSSVAVCQMDQIDLLSELVKLDYSAWQRPLLRQALAPVQGPLLLLGAAGAGIAPDLNIQQQWKRAVRGRVRSTPLKTETYKYRIHPLRLNPPQVLQGLPKRPDTVLSLCNVSCPGISNQISIS